ncbi:MAG: hypothetical protein EAX96_04165 [Candidatus Lokiarchaeota archaeon]|nr:hypothetical protein [Candidatus Lokiarchaeota archaeon]
MNLILQAEKENPISLTYFPPYTYQKGIDIFFRLYPHNLNVVYKANITPILSINLTSWMEKEDIPFLICYNLTELGFLKVNLPNYIMTEPWVIEFDISYDEYWGPLAAIWTDFHAIYFYNASKTLVFYCYFDSPIVA